MGLTIHWSFGSRTRSPNQAREQVAHLRGRALDLPFEQVEDIVELIGADCDFENCEQDDPNRWLLIRRGGMLSDRWLARQITLGQQNRTFVVILSPVHLRCTQDTATLFRPADIPQTRPRGTSRRRSHTRIQIGTACHPWEQSH